MKKQTIFISIGILLFVQSLSAYENYLFRSVDFKYKHNMTMTLYDYVHNPVYFNMDIENDYYIYQEYNNYSENNYYRTFDSKINRTYGISLFNYKVLDDKSNLCTAVIYDWTRMYDMYGSLEKNFYDHYFSFTDTTTGNTTYYGPRLWLLYQNKLSKNITSALQIDYGIERGLKDVFTECGTVFRNVTVNVGLAYTSNDKSLITGIYGRYLDRQGKYEAVEDLISAENYSYIGYFTPRHESPRSTNTKSDWVKGYETGFNIKKVDLFVKNLSYDLILNYGTNANKIKTGSTSKLVTLGFWVRDVKKINNRLSYKIKPLRTEISFLYDITRSYDWVKHGQFEVSLIEHESTIQKNGLELTVAPIKMISMKAGVTSQINKVDYVEYVSDYAFNEDLKNNTYYIDLHLPINSILNVYTGYDYSIDETYFYWDTPEFKIQSAYLAWDRLFVFGRIGMKIEYSKWDPEKSNKNIETYGLSFSYSR